MNAWSQILEVAKRDFLQRAQSRAFQILTAVTVAAVIGVVLLIGSQIGKSDPEVVGVVGDSPAGFEMQLLLAAESLGLETEIKPVDSVVAGESALQNGELAALVVDGAELVFAEETSTRLATAINTTFQGFARDVAIADLALTGEQVARIVSPPGLTERIVAPRQSDDTARQVAAQASAILLYMAILIFGQFVLMGVMEEKQSRVVEVVLSRVNAERLLAGKVLGIGALGLGQLLIIGGALLGAVLLADFGIGVPKIGFTVLAQTVLWFVLGFSLYSVLYAGLGATVTRQEDSQGAAMLPALLLIPGYFASFAAVDDPAGLPAVIGSFVPFSAPIVMPVRAASGTVPIWQVSVSIALVVLTTYAAIRIAARVYRGAVLSIGQKVKVRDAFRSAGRRAPDIP